MKFLTAFVALLCFANVALAEDEQKLRQVEQNIKKANNGRFADTPVTVYSKLEQPGFENLYIAVIGGQPIVIDESGTLAVVGKLIDLDKGSDLSARYINKDQLDKAKNEFASLSDDDVVLFPAKGESKGEMYVLTDPTCGYCRKLHGEIDILNNAGIDVKYVVYPRSALVDGETPYEQTKQIMCARDKRDALDKLKKQTDSGMFEQANYAKECVERVHRGRAVGDSLGISGTPFIYLSTGEIIGGYQPAETLVNYFKDTK